MTKKGLMVTILVMSLLASCGINQGDVEETVLSQEVIVQVNGQDISIQELDDRFVQKYTVNGLDNNDSQISRIKKATLEELIDEKLLVQEATRRGISPDLEYVSSETEKMKNIFTSQEEFNRKFADVFKMSPASFEKQLKTVSMIEQLLEQEYDGVVIDAKGYYDQSMELFYKDAQVDVIILTTSDEMVYEEMIERLDAGESIEEVVQVAQIENQSIQQEYLGYISKEMDKRKLPVEVFEFAGGQFLSRTIDDEHEFEIIYVVDHVKAQQLPFEEVKEEITAQLHYYAELEKYDVLLKKLRQEAEIIYAEEASE